jgi:hypothetical protein
MPKPVVNEEVPTWVKAFYTPLVKNQAAAKIVAEHQRRQTLACDEWRSTNEGEK